MLRRAVHLHVRAHMVPGQAAADLSNRLKELGFRFETPSAYLAWKAFTSHLTVPVDAPSFVLIEVGTYSNLGTWLPFEPAFTLDLCRQFEFRDADDEFDHYEQLHLALFAKPTAATEAMKTDFFLDHDRPLDSFISAVEKTPLISAVLRHSFCHAKLDHWRV